MELGRWMGMRGKKIPEHKAVTEGFTAFAGLFVFLAAAAKVAAWVFAPGLLVSLAIALGVRSPGFLAIAAGFLAIVATAFGAIAGLARCYSWVRDRRSR
jgi:hypothetical protein